MGPQGLIMRPRDTPWGPKMNSTFYYIRDYITCTSLKSSTVRHKVKVKYICQNTFSPVNGLNVSVWDQL